MGEARGGEMERNGFVADQLAIDRDRGAVVPAGNGPPVGQPSMSGAARRATPRAGVAPIFAAARDRIRRRRLSPGWDNAGRRCGERPAPSA